MPTDYPFAQPGGAVFLDRDGVITPTGEHVNRAEDLLLAKGAGKAIARLNRAGLPVIVVTNQGGIAMGHLTEQDLMEIHEYMQQQLAQDGGHVDAIYYCPHHPQATQIAYLADCSCRKPGTAMLEKARDELGIDLRKSVLIGDTTTDILAGVRAGCRTILVRTGYGGKDNRASVDPDAVATDLVAAIDLILADLANGSPPSRASSLDRVNGIG